jgi:hypothetical protein
MRFLRSATAAGQPQTVRAAIVTATPLEQAARFERVDHADHGRAVEADRLREPALRHARVGVDQEQHAGAAGRNFGHAGGEIAEHGLLRAPQPVTEQSGQHARLKRHGARHWFGLQDLWRC